MGITARVYRVCVWLIYFALTEEVYPLPITKLLYGSIHGGLVNTLAAEGLEGGLVNMTSEAPSVHLVVVELR